MKRLAKKIIEILTSNEVESYSFTMHYTFTFEDDDNEEDATGKLCFQFSERNTPMNIILKLDIPFSISVLRQNVKVLESKSDSWVLNVIKENFDCTIDMLLNEDYYLLAEFFRELV